MRNNFKKFASRAVVIPALIALTIGSALAQTAPTTATALAQSVDMSDAKAAGLVIIGLLVAAGVVLWGGRLVLSKFQPKL